MEHEGDGKTEKAVEHEGEGYANGSWCTWHSPQTLEKRNERVENWRSNRGHLDFSIVEIGQITEKSPGDLKILVVTQPLVKDSQLMLVGKNHKE